MVSTREKKEKTRWITEGVTIAATSLIGYLLAFVYEAAYASFFGIPPQFISIGLTQIFIAVGALWASSILFFPVFDAIFQIIPKIADVLYPFFWRVTFLVLLAVAGFYSYPEDWPIWLLMVGLVAVLFLLDFLHQRARKSNREKLTADVQRNTLIDHVAAGLGRRGFAICLIVGFFFLLSYVLGRGEAERKKEFLTIRTKPEMVVLRVYEDKLILAPFDRKTKRIERSFSVIRLGDKTNVLLRLERIGPLRVKE